MALMDDVQKALRWQTLVTHYIEGFNPRLEREVVALDCALALPISMIPDDVPMRHVAHAVCWSLARLCDKQEPRHLDHYQAIRDWVVMWWDQYGV